MFTKEIIKYNNINFKQIKPKVNDTILYNNKPLYFQTSYHTFQDNELQINNDPNKSISSKSKLIIGITPNMAIYHFYKKLDDYFDNHDFRNKYFTNSRIKYRPIINNNNITYHLPYKKIRNLIPFDFDYNQYYDENDDLLMKFIVMSNNKYYDYSYKYKLFNSQNEIKFKSFDEFITFIKNGVYIRFIIKPTLIYDYEDSVYFIRLETYMIEINNNTNNIEYAYEYLFHRIPHQLRNDIHSERYKPENLDELIKDEIITTSHLFLK